MELCELTIHEAANLLAARSISAVELMRSVLDQIDRLDESVGAYISVRTPEELLAEADRADKQFAHGSQTGPLTGIPLAIKDNLCTKGLRTSCASQMLANFTPPYDAAAVSALTMAGGIIVGKTNMDEFAMGSSTENSAMHITRNPHNLERVPGGTSGGSAAAVAANMCIAALGTDTGGSIRQPASFCGVVGMKPTYGLVSRYGLIAYGSSLDHVGALTKDVQDARFLTQVISYHDPRDSTCLDVDRTGILDARAERSRLKIGVPREYFGEGLDADVRDCVTKTLDLLSAHGHETVEVTLPLTEYAIPTYYIIACSEASSNLARYDGCQYGHRCRESSDFIQMVCRTRAEGFGAEVKRRIMLGTYALSSGYYDAFYLKATKVRSLLAQDFHRAFQDCDLLLHPVAPSPAYRIGEKIEDPLAMYLGDIYTIPANLIGLPAISIPVAYSRDGLPIGVQFTGPVLSDGLVLDAAQMTEKLLLNRTARKAGDEGDDR